MHRPARQHCLLSVGLLWCTALLSPGCAPIVLPGDTPAPRTSWDDEGADWGYALSPDHTATVLSAQLAGFEFTPDVFGRFPYVFVAASDAPDWQRDIAQYVCDGFTDEEEINEAVAGLSDTGGIVELSLGTFNIDSHVDISCDNLIFRGMGPGTLLQKAGRDTWSVVSQKGANHHILVEDFQVDGRNIGHPRQSGNKCLFINGNYEAYEKCHHVIIQRIVAHNATAEAICVDYCHEVTVQDCHSYDSAWSGVTVAQVSGARILNNHCDNCGTGNPSASLGAGINAQSSENVLITGNHVENCNDRGIGVSWHATYSDWPLRNITIRDNVLENNAPWPSIQVWSPSDDLILETIKVMDNFVYGDVGVSIGVYVSNVDGFEVVRNVVDGYGPYGIYGTATAANGVVRDNWIGAGYEGSIRMLGDRVDAYRAEREFFYGVLAADSDYVVAKADCSGPTPVILTVADQPDYPRQLSWEFESHNNITDFTIHFQGLDGFGRTVGEFVTEEDGWSGTTRGAFLRLTAVRLYQRTGDGIGDTVDIGVTDKLGLGLTLGASEDVLKVTENGEDIDHFSLDPTTGLLDVGPIADGDDIIVYYREPMNHHLY